MNLKNGMSLDASDSRDPIPTETGANGTAGDILVVDDNPANLIAIEAALGAVGGRVMRAQSGNEALRLLLERDFALILMDVRMPSMDGLETARVIRARKRSRHTPIMFVTAHGSDDQDVLAAYKLGAVDFLFKPIIPEVLQAKAAVFVELKRRTAEVARQAEQIREHERREHERALGEERAWWEAESLRRQMEQLEEADRRKDHFLAVLGHELRNPLAPIVTGLEVLRCKLAHHPGTDDTVLRTREGMERQALHLTRLVDDLLDISRINSGKIELQKTPLAIQDVVEQAIEISRPGIDQKQHRLSVDMPRDPIMIFGDAVRLVQVMANLLNNAARYTEAEGQIGIQCRLHGDRVEIRVADNGRGISPEFRPRLFDMFAQEQPSAGSGLGLGLSVVKRLVTMHEGTVTATHQAIGKGSEFVIELPVMMSMVDAPSPVSVSPELMTAAELDTAAKLDAVAKHGANASQANSNAINSNAINSNAINSAATNPAATNASAANATTSKSAATDSAATNPAAAHPAATKAAAGARLRVVLVEDNDDVRDIMQELLTVWGHTVEVATDGVSGVELILRLRPDVALVDIGLPQLDGYGVATRVRSALNGRDVRLVAMTGFGQDSDRQRAQQAGFDAHLVKPPDVEALQKVLSAREA